MIIKRQRLYTRNDVKVLKELHQATNGFRKLPKGYKNLTTRDYFRLNNFAEGFNKAFEKGNTKSIDWNEFETLANHLGLPETAKGSKHLVEKYTNPKLLARYKRIQKLKENPEQKKKIEQLRKEYAKDYKKLKKDADDAFEEAAKSIKFENGKLIEDSKTVQKANDAELALDERAKRFKQDKLQQISEPGAKFRKRQQELLEKARKKYESSQPEHQNRELYEELKKEAESWGYTVKHGKDGGSVSIKRKIIDLENKNPATLAHELGHIKHDYRQGTRKGKNHGDSLGLSFDAAVDKHPIGRWEDERGATIEGLASMKTKRSANKEDIEAAEKHLADAFRTYYHGGLSKVPEIIARKLGQW